MNFVLVSIRGNDLDSMKVKIVKELKTAICQVRGLRVKPEEINFQFGLLPSCRASPFDKKIEIMVILDPYPGLEEIDNLDAEIIKTEAKQAAESVAVGCEIAVFLRCANSCVGDYCWD